MTNKVQKHLIDLIYEEVVREYPVMKDKSITKISRYIFKNERQHTGFYNLRLTILGFTYISKHIKFFTFPIKNQKLGMKELVWLDRTQKYPYHYEENSNIFHTACPNLSMLLKLSDSAFETIIKN